MMKPAFRFFATISRSRTALRGEDMKIDDVISHYIGRVVRDRKAVERSPGEGHERELDRDQTVLAALRCAKANGFSGEE